MPIILLESCGLVGVISDSFAICSGVRQGGILSPFLFGIYIDELSSQLQSKHIGCRLSNIVVNHCYLQAKQ